MGQPLSIAMHCSHSVSTTGAELRMSIRYKGNASMWSNEAHFAVVDRLCVIDDLVLASCCWSCC